jgi:hypothetical protein
MKQICHVSINFLFSSLHVVAYHFQWNPQQCNNSNVSYVDEIKEDERKIHQVLENEKKNEHNILVVQLEQRRDLGLDGMIILQWIVMKYGAESVDWIHLSYV